MDPISATLAVITFATSVKDIIELGQKIHESFAKVSNNFQSAQRVAVDIKEMLEEIGVFCDEHADRLENMKDFKAAVLDLVRKLRTFEASVLPLLTKSGKGVSGRLIRGWDAWRKSAKIEGSIVELQSDIVKVMRRHMLKSSMRAEVKLEAIHRTTSIGLADVKNGLDRVHKDVSALRVTTVIQHAALRRTDEEFEQNVVALANSSSSTSAPMLRSPTVITVELMNKAYITSQIHDILSIFERMSESKLLVGSPSNDALVPYMVFGLSDDGYVNAMRSTLSLGHDIVRRLTGIRGLLDSRVAHTVSFSSAFYALSGLLIGLHRLTMAKETILVSEWAVKLARMHLKSYGNAQPDGVANLALTLFNHSTFYNSIADHDKALRAVEEAHALSQGIQSSHPGNSDFLNLHAEILIDYATLVDDHRSVGLLTEAVQLLDTFLGVRTFTEDFVITEGDDEFLTQVWGAAQSWSILYSYARAVLVLGRYLLSNGKHRAGTDLQHLAILVYRKFPHDMSTESLADALLRTALDARVGFSTAEQALQMLDESAQLYRALCDENPVFYASKQATALWHKAMFLNDLNRRPEAIATWEEVASLSKQIMQDEALYAHALHRLAKEFQELDRHQDAVRTLTLAITTYTQDAEAQADRYFLLGMNYAQLHLYREAMQALHTSAGVYRRLALKDPEVWMDDFAATLAHLAQCFVALGDYAEARFAWKESISILEKQLSIMSTADCDEIATYMKAVDVVYSLSSLLEDKNDCVDLCGAVAQILRTLSGISTNNSLIAKGLVNGELLLGYDYLRLGYPVDSARHLTDTLVSLEIPRPHMTASTRSFYYVSTLNTKARALDAQGYTEQAILALRKALSSAKPLYLDDVDHCCLFIEATTQQAQFLASLGQADEAHQTAAEALRISRETHLERKDESLAWALRAAALTALASGQYDLALALAEEGCNVWATQANLKLWRESKDHNIDDYNTIFGRPGLMGLMSSALLNLGRIEEALQWAQRAVDASLEMRNTGRMRISASTARQSYMETNGRLAIALLASGQLSEAKDIFEETRAYFAQRVDRMMGDNRELAPILLALSLLYCHEGRHEEGHAAGKELLTLLERLGYAFASLEKQVKIRLRLVSRVHLAVSFATSRRD